MNRFLFALCPVVCLASLCAAPALAEENEVLISGRMEMIFLHSVTDPIRQSADAHSRLYFNNIFLNLEGDLGGRSHFIVEFQPLTSDLYLLGGFLTIADALQGLALDEDVTPRKVLIDQIIDDRIGQLDEASRRPSFERAAVSFYGSGGLGLSIGRVRNPFGFWDDYSLFRNLSALKTDPVTLGVALRRTDLGALFFGRAGPADWQVGILEGTNTLGPDEDDDHRDVAARLGATAGSLDVAASGYIHDLGKRHWNRALGLSYRWRATYDLALLGEFIHMANDALDLETQGFYVQANYDLSEQVADGLRWNLFFETYDSDLLAIDLEPDLDYRFAGTYFQVSTGFVYALQRNIDLGAKLLSGADEEGDPFYKVALKIDARF